MNGPINARFSLWLSPAGQEPPNQVGAVATADGIEVVNGLFSVELDFGQDSFNGNARWLQIEIHDHADPPGMFTTLAPRQPLTPTPYALQTRGIVVRQDGNVGIGTKEPTSKLEIAAQNGLAITGYQPFLTLRDTNNADLRSVIQGADGKIIFYPASFIGGNPAMFINNGDGNVGIGTTSPIGGLHVKKEPFTFGGTLSLEGSTHSYVSFFPQGAVAGRKAWLGFGGPGTNELSIWNEAGGNINLITSGDVVINATLDIGYEIVSFRDTSDRFAGAVCPTGKRVIGGGCECIPNEIINSQPFANGGGWFCQCPGDDVTAIAICANVK